jgi:hypothetical protein
MQFDAHTVRLLLFVAEQDYRDPPSLPTAINDVTVQPRVTLSRPDAIEERDVLLCLQESRHTLVLGAVFLCDERRVLDIAAVSDLRRVRVALQQKRL